MQACSKVVHALKPHTASAPMFVSYDASIVALGAVLSQIHQGGEHPVTFVRIRELTF